MTHVGDRMAMLRFQQSRPYTWRSGGSCGCNCGSNFSVFNQYGCAPRSFGFGGDSGLFRAGFITNLVFGCLDYAMNWTGQILGWCGIGGSQQTVHEAPKKEGEKSDYQMLVNEFGEKNVRSLGDGKYEVIHNGVHETGTYDEILTKTNKKAATQAPDRTGGGDQGGGTKKTDAEKTQIKQETEQKMNADENKDQVVLPAGAQKTVTVDDNGKVTITINYQINGKNKTAQATGDDAEKAVDELTKQCQEIQKGIADAELAKQNPAIQAPKGYKIETAGAKDEKTQATYILKKEADGTTQEFDSIEELKAAIGKINRPSAEHTSHTPSRTKASTPLEKANKAIKDANLENNIRIEGDKIVFRYHGGGTKTVAFTPENLEAVIQDEKEYAARTAEVNGNKTAVPQWSATKDRYGDDQNFISKNGQYYELESGKGYLNTSSIDQEALKNGQIKVTGDREPSYLVTSDHGTIWDYHGSMTYQNKYPLKTDNDGTVLIQTQKDGEWIPLSQFLNEH